MAFDKLTEEGQKVAHPLVIMRWLSGTGDEAQIIRLNEFANKYIFSLGNDKALLFRLLAAACTGKTQRAQWIKGPGSSDTKLTIQVICDRYECSTREAASYVGMLDTWDVIRCAEEIGWDKDQLKKLTTELDKDNGPGSTPKSRIKSKK